MLKLILLISVMMTITSCSTTQNHKIISPSYLSSSSSSDESHSFEIIDKNDDGFVDSGELEAVGISRFKKLDSDQDGIHKGLLLTDYLKKMDEALIKVDRDNNQKLSPTEFEELKNMEISK